VTSSNTIYNGTNSRTFDNVEGGMITIKDKTKISLTIKILHLGQDSFTRKVRTIFTLKIIISIFVKLFLILVSHLRQFFIVRLFVKKIEKKDGRGIGAST
jgi:hypothetical protein